MGTIFCGGVVMPAAFASDCGGLSARQSVSPSSMLFPSFGFGCRWCAGVFPQWKIDVVASVVFLS